MGLYKKTNMLIKCIFTYLKYKLRYRGRMSMDFINSIKGSLNIDLFQNAKCSVGKFLMTSGPFYIKCTENAELTIGDNCFFNHNCSLTSAEHIEIGNNCMFANNLVVVDHDHDRENGKISEKLITAPVKIGNNVWCGANVTILKGVTIGDGAIVAAGAVVTRNVEAHTVVAGVPAKKIESKSR